MSVLRGSCPRAINGRLCGATTVSALGYCLHCGAYRPEHEQTPVASHITGAAEDWINPETMRASCPSCDGYGYHEDGSDDDTDDDAAEDDTEPEDDDTDNVEQLQLDELADDADAEAAA